MSAAVTMPMHPAGAEPGVAVGVGLELFLARGAAEEVGAAVVGD